MQDVYLHFGLHPSRARALLRQSSDRVPAARLRRRVSHPIANHDRRARRQVCAQLRHDQLAGRANLRPPELTGSGPSVNTSNPIASGSLDTGHSQDRLTRTVGPVQSSRSEDRGGGMNSPPLPLAHTNATSRAPGLQNPVCVGRRNPARAREWDPLTARASRQQSCQVQTVAEERILVTSQERGASRSCLSPGGTR